METKNYPLATTIIKLNDTAFQVDVVQDGVVKFTIDASTGLVGLSATDTDFVLTIPSTELSLQTELAYDTIRTFEASQNAFASCDAGMIGVVDIRDLRITYNWCVSVCPITILLGQNADRNDTITVYRSSDEPSCFQEFQSEN